jgi:hypothetical protein
MAQSWAWRTVGGAVVFDSVESVTRETSELGPVFALYKLGMEKILKSALGISAVRIGITNSGITAKVRTALNAAGSSHELPADNCGYFDGEEHALVCGTKPTRSKKKTLPQVEGYARQPVKRRLTRAEEHLQFMELTAAYRPLYDQLGNEWAGDLDSLP